MSESNVAAFRQGQVALSRAGLRKLLDASVPAGLRRNLLLLGRVEGWLPMDYITPKVLDTLDRRGLVEKQPSTGSFRLTDDARRIASVLEESE